MEQDQNRQGQRQEGMRPLPKVGRARGLIAVWEQTRREEGTRRGELAFGYRNNPGPWQSSLFGLIMGNGNQKCH